MCVSHSLSSLVLEDPDFLHMITTPSTANITAMISIPRATPKITAVGRVLVVGPSVGSDGVEPMLVYL